MLPTAVMERAVTAAAEVVADGKAGAAVPVAMLPAAAPPRTMPQAAPL